MFYVNIPMFHVEQQVIMRILVLFITIMLISCNKPNQNPELADEIYQTLQSQASEAKKDAEGERKKLEGFKKDVDKSVPLSGELKHAQKRYFESEARVQKLEQLTKYYELKAEERKQYTKTEYLKAFKEGKPWPTEAELEAFKQYKISSKVEPGWDSRKRVSEYERGAKKPESPSKH